MTQITYNDAGMAAFNSEDITEVSLFSGKATTAITNEEVASTVVSSVALPANSVVGRNSSGKLVLATLASGSEVYALGVTTHTVAAAATGNGLRTGLRRDGTFNPAALNWHSSYDTDEKKRLAFEKLGAPIFIQKYQA